MASFDRAQEAPAFASNPAAVQEANGWALGFVLFASIAMIILGLFHAFFGLAAVFEGSFLVTDTEYPYEINITLWGALHLTLGIIVMVAGALLFSGKPWAMIVAIVVAALSAVSAFLSIPNHPVWSLLILVFAIGVIWSLTAHGSEIARATEE